VKGERLESFLQNALHTERFARYVGKRCRSGTIKDVAEELNLDWHTVKRLEKHYMREQLKRSGTPRPKVIGIDEISVRKGHEYRIVVSDLEKHRPIWFGGADRSEASMDEFYRFLGEKPANRVRLAVMDMWKPFRNSTAKNVPQAAILFDKFHIIRHLGEALDKVRKHEFARLSGKPRTFIKGQKYALLSHPQNLKGPARKNLQASARGQQAPQHRLHAQGVVWPALGLQQRDLGTEVLRELACAAEMATSEALREVRRHDRAALGRYRCLLQTGKQSRPWLRRRLEQQDPRDPAPCLRFA
jgi:hypothetical protein